MFQRHPIQHDVPMFITTNTLDRHPVFANPGWAREVIESLYRTQELHPFLLYAFVVMPDHCHLLLKILQPETISGIMRIFKYGSSVNIGKGPIWQSRFHVRLPSDYGAVLQYIHENPVKAGLAKESHLYPWSSASGKWDITPLPWSPSFHE